MNHLQGSLCFYGACGGSHQDQLGLVSGAVAPQIYGLQRVPGQGPLNAALVLRAAADVAVVRVFGADFLLSVHR